MAQHTVLPSFHRLLNNSQVRTFLTSQDDHHLLHRSILHSDTLTLSTLPFLPPHTPLCFLPCISTSTLTLGFAVSESPNCSLGRVVKHHAAGLVLLAGPCGPDVIELVLWHLISHHNTSAHVARFHAPDFSRMLSSSTDIHYTALTSALVTCRPLAEAHTRHAPCDGVYQLNNYSRVSSNLHIIKAGGCRQVAEWILSLSGESRMACPVSLITGMFSQNNPFGGTHSCSNPNTGPSSAVKRVAVRELLVDESTMEQGSALEGREVTNACGKGWYSSKEDASYTTDVASVSTTNDTKQSATKAEEGHMGTPPLVKIEPMPMSSGTQIGTNAIVKTKDEGVLPQRRLLRLAPAPAKVCAPVCATTTCVVPSGGTILELEERRKKMELRKARNRESAQRSNYKRKMKLQALREELEKVSRREKLLRARERTLRQENISLRMTGSR